MQRLGLIAAVVLAFFSLSLSAQVTNTCDYVVKKVWFESANGLSPEQLQKLHALVEGRCYDPSNPGPVSRSIYDQLRAWGYRRVEVYEPAGFRTLEDGVYPAPVSFVIDFQVNDLSNCPAVQPRDAGYEAAMALRQLLEENGIEVWCVGRSKMYRAFEGQLDAALFITAQGRFEALFFPPQETFQNLVIASDYKDGWYAYTFSGKPRWQAANQTVIMKSPWYVVRARNRLFMTGKMPLAARLESIFGLAGSESRAANKPSD